MKSAQVFTFLLLFCILFGFFKVSSHTHTSKLKPLLLLLLPFKKTTIPQTKEKNGKNSTLFFSKLVAIHFEHLITYFFIPGQTRFHYTFPKLSKQQVTIYLLLFIGCFSFHGMIAGKTWWKLVKIYPNIPHTRYVPVPFPELLIVFNKLWVLLAARYGKRSAEF